MIHEQIARYRKLKGLTQEQLGETLGVSNRTVSKWESGASLPGADIIPEIADALGVSLHTLYGIDTQQEEQDLAGLIRETIRTELERILPDAVEKAVTESCGSGQGLPGAPKGRELSILSRDRSQIVRTPGSANIAGPVAREGAPDQWQVNVLDHGKRYVTVGEYDTKEEAETALKAILDAWSGGYSSIAL